VIPRLLFTQADHATNVDPANAVGTYPAPGDSLQPANLRGEGDGPNPERRQKSDPLSN